MRQRIGSLAVALLALLAPLAGCDDGPTTPANADAQVAGSYTLVTVDGDALPAIVSENIAGVVQALAGTMALAADSTYIETVALRFTPRGGGEPQLRTLSRVGRFSVQRNVVQFRSDAVDPYTGLVAGRDLTFNSGGVLFAYRRE